MVAGKETTESHVNWVCRHLISPHGGALQRGTREEGRGEKFCFRSFLFDLSLVLPLMSDSECDIRLSEVVSDATNQRSISQCVVREEQYQWLSSWRRLARVQIVADAEDFGRGKPAQFVCNFRLGQIISLIGRRLRCSFSF